MRHDEYCGGGSEDITVKSRNDELDAFRALRALGGEEEKAEVRGGKSLGQL